jgi:non-homologous end joining protein Ku
VRPYWKGYLKLALVSCHACTSPAIVVAVCEDR